MSNDRQLLVCASGYFDPLHRGHVEYLQLAKRMFPGSNLCVIVNNDRQAKLKYGGSVIPERDRLAIMKALKCVDSGEISIDSDLTVNETLMALMPDVFVKGGDRKAEEIPEAAVCKRYNIQIIDGLGDKIFHSSHIREALK